jgi:hypothetical protein
MGTTFLEISFVDQLVLDKICPTMWFTRFWHKAIDNVGFNFWIKFFIWSESKTENEEMLHPKNRLKTQFINFLLLFCTGVFQKVTGSISLLSLSLSLLVAANLHLKI